jgi:hypothetical protein
MHHVGEFSEMKNEKRINRYGGEEFARNGV